MGLYSRYGKECMGLYSRYEKECMGLYSQQGKMCRVIFPAGERMLCLVHLVQAITEQPARLIRFRNHPSVNQSQREPSHWSAAPDEFNHSVIEQDG
jgi:hypothetical protein